eukprot:gene10820-12802_t
MSEADFAAEVAEMEAAEQSKAKAEQAEQAKLRTVKNKVSVGRPVEKKKKDIPLIPGLLLIDRKEEKKPENPLDDDVLKRTVAQDVRERQLAEDDDKKRERRKQDESVSRERERKERERERQEALDRERRREREEEREAQERRRMKREARVRKEQELRERKAAADAAEFRGEDYWLRFYEEKFGIGETSPVQPKPSGHWERLYQDSFSHYCKQSKFEVTSDIFLQQAGKKKGHKSSKTVDPDGAKDYPVSPTLAEALQAEQDYPSTRRQQDPVAGEGGAAEMDVEVEGRSRRHEREVERRGAEDRSEEHLDSEERRRWWGERDGTRASWEQRRDSRDSGWRRDRERTNPPRVISDRWQPSPEPEAEAQAGKARGARSRDEEERKDRSHKKRHKRTREGSPDGAEASSGGEEKRRRRRGNKSPGTEPTTSSLPADAEPKRRRRTAFDQNPNEALQAAFSAVQEASMNSEAGSGVASSAAVARIAALTTGGASLQQTRHARRVYVGGLPVGTTETEITLYFNSLMTTTNACSASVGPGAPVVSVYINHEKKFAFVEFRTVEEASNAMAFEGVAFAGSPMRIRRPNDYNPSQAALLGPTLPSSGMNMAALGLTNVAVSSAGNDHKLFVGGLPYYLDEEQVKELLSNFGTLRSFNLVLDRDTGQSKGYGFCLYEDPGLVDTAIAGLNGLAVGDKMLTVRRANATGISLPSEMTGIGSVPAVPSGNAPSRWLQLLGMIRREELLDAEEAADITEDTRTECGRFGTVLDVYLPMPGSSLDEDPAGVASICVEFAAVEEAQKAQ